MTNHWIKRIAMAAALGMSAFPFAAAHADRTEVKISGTFISQVSACANALAAADRAFYEPARQTRTIGACTCEQIGVDRYAEGGPKPTYQCAVRIEIRDK